MFHAGSSKRGSPINIIYWRLKIIIISDIKYFYPSELKISYFYLKSNKLFFGLEIFDSAYGPAKQLSTC